MSSAFTMVNEPLGADIRGVKFNKEGIDIVQFRGLQYGRISERFASPTLVAAKDVDGAVLQAGKRYFLEAREFG